MWEQGQRLRSTWLDPKLKGTETTVAYVPLNFFQGKS
jgi:hypothetical protein